MSLFPQDDKGRKALPIFKMLTGYFPKAMREITRVCVANNVRYSPEREPADIHWARGKSPDQLGSAFRHMLERQVDGTVYEAVSADVTAKTGIERVYVLAEAAWRVCAALELEIEVQEGINTQYAFSGIPEAPGAAIAPPPAISVPPIPDPWPDSKRGGPALILRLESEDPDTVGEFDAKS